MPSITTWTRLEPDPQTSLNDSLQARVYDPLWLLARQWQLGEFLGEDCGSPVGAVLRGESAQLTRYVLGTPEPTPLKGDRFDVQQTPLDTLVQREPVRRRPASASPNPLGARAEAGQHFLRILAQQSFGSRYHLAFIKLYPMPTLSQEQMATLGEPDVGFIRLMTGRVPDGIALAAALRRSTLPGELGIAPSHESAVREAGQTFLKWYDEFISEPVGNSQNAAWSSSRLEYAFSVSAPLGTSNASAAETVLTAQEYHGGPLDWYAVDLAANKSLGAAADRVAGKNPSPFLQTVIPAPVTYRGMPEVRWWEFEDAAVNFGAIDPEPEDLARMLLIEFASAYANDWFVIPVEMPIGSICKIQSLVVRDTFGQRTLIPSITASTHPASPSWRMFHQSLAFTTGPTGNTPPADRDIFFLAPTVPRSLEGTPIEEVLFLRDEMANLVWGIERVTEGVSGRPINRSEAYLRQRRQGGTDLQAPAAQDTLTWHLATETPDHWIPLIPVRVKEGEPRIVFRRGGTVRQDGSLKTKSADSKILKPDGESPLDIFEEEIPREGVRVLRTYQYARWLNGRSLLWLGRQKRAGRGEGSSGLRFDTTNA